MVVERVVGGLVEGVVEAVEEGDVVAVEAPPALEHADNATITTTITTETAAERDG